MTLSFRATLFAEESLRGTRQKTKSDSSAKGAPRNDRFIIFFLQAVKAVPRYAASGHCYSLIS